MIVVLYTPPGFARFYTGFGTTFPLINAENADRHHNPNNRKIVHARLVHPPMYGFGYCVDCVRRFEYDEIGTVHQGHLVDIRDLRFNATEARDV